ncbi:unnamed protein product, partial [marine sediment metagenome]
NIAKFVHIPGYQKCNNVEVVAICDNLKERAARIPMKQVKELIKS